MKRIWGLSAIVFALSGWAIVSLSHQSVANRVVPGDPGSSVIIFDQPFAGFGKGVGLICLIGTATSLVFATRSETTPRLALPPARPTQRPQRLEDLTRPEEVEYDEDVAIDLDDLEAPPSPQNVAGAVNIFELMYSHRKRHLFIPAETGAGKTTLLLGAIDWGHRQFQGQIEFFGSTAKVSPWLGLEEQPAEDGKPRILTINPDQPETILPLVSRLNWLRRRLRKRGEQRLLCEQQNKPYRPCRNVVVLEEWNETLATALRYDRAFNAARDKETPVSTVYANLVDAVESFARLGREDEMAIWIFAQDHQVQNAAINTGYRKNFGFVVPGRANGGMAGLEDAFLGKSPIVAA
ncbi:MAG TPA: hypothetical protein V6D18_15520, partial [Thermosynechococcaceae cyanobacterium]